MLELRIESDNLLNIRFLKKNWQLIFFQKTLNFHQFEKPGVYHTVAFPCTLKKYLKAKEELWKLKNYNLPKKPLKETKILQDIATR
jgi:hypothetical protein